MNTVSGDSDQYTRNACADTGKQFVVDRFSLFSLCCRGQALSFILTDKKCFISYPDIRKLANIYQATGGAGEHAAREAVEIGVVVADEWQGRGIGERLVRRLLLRAAAGGAAEVVMEVLAENRRVLAAIRRRRPDAAMRAGGGTVEVNAALRDAEARLQNNVLLRHH